MRAVASVESVDVDVEVAGSGTCFEPRYGFLDLKTFV